MEGIRIGIIGIGNMGSAHLHCIYNGEIKGMTLTAVCDIDDNRLSKVKESYEGLKLYKDYRDLLADSEVDAVVVATPHPSHAQIGIDALRAKKHILIEKPIDISVGNAEKLNAEAQKQGKVFGIMFNQRTNGLFARAKKIMANGELGELKRTVWIITNWYRTQHYYDSGAWRATWAGEGGGVLLNQAPHNLDLWQWICGMPKSVTAFCNVAKYHNIEVEDEATIYTEYENGATGVFITSTGDYPGTNRLEISGSKGKIVIENGVLKHWKLPQDEREICYSSSDSSIYIKGDYTEFKTEKELAHKGILQNFTNSILNGEELLAKGTEGINELTISNAAYLSQWKGNVKIELPFNTEEFDKILNEKAAASTMRSEKKDNMSKEYNPRWQVKW